MSTHREGGKFSLPVPLSRAGTQRIKEHMLVPTKPYCSHSLKKNVPQNLLAVGSPLDHVYSRNHRVEDIPANLAASFIGHSDVLQLTERGDADRFHPGQRPRSARAQQI